MSCFDQAKYAAPIHFLVFEPCLLCPLHLRKKFVLLSGIHRDVASKSVSPFLTSAGTRFVSDLVYLPYVWRSLAKNGSCAIKPQTTNQRDLSKSPEVRCCSVFEWLRIWPPAGGREEEFQVLPGAPRMLWFCMLLIEQARMYLDGVKLPFDSN
ncbi:hypothetical protein AVEN_221238-1 [Araneus ventricosus]|uniref:Uncharacterized protein n=1 Tax=Araneus ventricosus TaxID=182803 RepID=A0A4Y2F8Y0_ARAVE|nr:hypothetical protein AVEN_221238-1 [Araneus ventricosus]